VLIRQGIITQRADVKEMRRYQWSINNNTLMKPVLPDDRLVNGSEVSHQSWERPVSYRVKAECEHVSVHARRQTNAYTETRTYKRAEEGRLSGHTDSYVNWVDE